MREQALQRVTWFARVWKDRGTDMSMVERLANTIPFFQELGLGGRLERANLIRFHYLTRGAETRQKGSPRGWLKTNPSTPLLDRGLSSLLI